MNTLIDISLDETFPWSYLEVNTDTNLSELLKGFPALNTSGPLDRRIASVAYDSRKVEEGGLFVAIPGLKHDGSKFIKDALDRKAAAIVTQSQIETVSGLIESNDASVICVEDARHALAWIASAFYKHPSKKMNLVGITGTNGKTTLTYILESIYQAHGDSCGVIGSINYRYGGTPFPAPMTTPESLEINQMLVEMANNNIPHCFLEVSSHSIALERVRELDFALAVFTNLSQDHLDFHGTMEIYKETKKSLFTKCNVGKQVINIDDPVGREILAESKKDSMTTGIEIKADVMAENCQLSEDGIKFMLQTPFGSREIQSPLLGLHNIHNMLAAAAASLIQGVSLDHVQAGLENLKIVPGRLQKVDEGQNFIVAVDYAHTDDALANALQAARAFTKNKVIAVFGCGGDRDRGKRKKMASVALSLSDFAVVTSDNPRTEDPGRIIDDICEGIPADAKLDEEYTLLPNRREAIEFAVNRADAGDTVLIAGKGHEDYQILKSGTIHFDDREVATEVLKKRLA